MIGSAVAALILAAAVAMAPQVAGAQDDAPAGRGGNRAAAPSNAQLANMLDAYALVQAQNVLELGDDQYGRFVPRLKRLQDTRRRNTQARSRILLELRKLTASPAADEGALRDRLKSLQDLEDQAARELRREYEALAEVLDVRQQARFRLFEERLERQKLDLLMRARDRAARRGQRGG